MGSNAEPVQGHLQSAININHVATSAEGQSSRLGLLPRSRMLHPKRLDMRGSRTDETSGLMECIQLRTLSAQAIPADFGSLDVRLWDVATLEAGGKGERCGAKLLNETSGRHPRQD